MPPRKKKPAKKTPRKKTRARARSKSSASSTSKPKALTVVEVLDPDEDPSLVPLEDVAFDEMNIVETPFALLTNDTRGHQNLPLSPGGHERLVTSDSAFGLPNALAEPTVLGLMWLSMRQNAFKSAVVRFSLRDLICNYIFPGRYKGTYTPSQKILKAVEQQINSVACTRIFTDRWYDKALQKRTKMNAAIIDYVQVVEEGGKNKARVLEVRWGAQFFKSITSQYTKPLDPALYQKIDNALDRRLYRWLDRQLALKQRQVVRSCQYFARYKLLMTGQKIEAGGRTASSYIVKRLKETLERLDGFGFSVRMVVDSGRGDFALEFQRLADHGPNEVVDEDLAGDLVRQFQLAAHGVPLDARRRRLREADRKAAQLWVDAYGFEQARWMVRRCAELQKQNGADRILVFKGLERYEQAAAGDYVSAKKRQAAQPDVDGEREQERLWEAYETQMVALADKKLAKKDQSALVAQAEGNVEEAHGRGVGTGFAWTKLIDIEVKSLKLKRVDAMHRDEFFSYPLDELRRVLERQGVRLS